MSLPEATVAAALAAMAAHQPAVPALVFPDVEISYRNLWRLSQAFAVRLAEAGVGPGALVALDGNETATVTALLMATSLLGARFLQGGPEPLDASLSVTHRVHTADRAGAAPAGSLLIGPDWSPTALTLEGPGAPVFPGAADADADWLIVHTSGTTGYPKYLALSQRMVTDRSLAVAYDFDGRNTRFVSLFPSTSRPFFARICAALMHGSTLVDGVAPADWHRFGVTMVCASQPQIRTALAGGTLAHRCPKLEISGAPLSLDEAGRLLDSFETVDDVYGASETNKSHINRMTRPADGQIRVMGVQTGCEIEIVDEAGNPVPQGQPGLVRVRNSYLARGYLNAPEAQARAFRDGWFHPGDIGYLTATGALRIVSRDDDVINIGGLKLEAMAIDAILREVDGILDAACFMNPKPGAPAELFAFVVFAPDCNRLQAVATAKYRCREGAGPAFVPRVIQGVAGIPRRADGRPNRTECAALILKLIRTEQD
ncbi:AMP-binding protein [Limimaricola sp.]|uniref:class I adenylate-forming enzyme family protein n=1 Tax=Limimaricola sp. TaxID=2211665 RepID=UPI0025BA875E|nr:AMP-binding protein [Limimaricola sp.]